MSGVTVKDAVWQALRKAVGKAAHSYVKVGVLKSGPHHGGVDIVELAAIHEFGAPAAGIPERSFLRRTFRDGEGAAGMKERQIELARAVIEGKTDIRVALGRLGLWATSAVRRRIRAGIDPSLKPTTIARKGSSLALVDTGQLINSITHEVVEES